MALIATFTASLKKLNAFVRAAPKRITFDSNGTCHIREEGVVRRPSQQLVASEKKLP